MPHFGYLPPATAAQAASVWALLHITPRMLHYSRLMDALSIFGALYELLLIWLALQTGFSSGLRNVVKRWTKRPLLIAAYYWALLGLFFLALNMPFDLYAGFALPHAYGLSREPLLAWFSDFFKDWGVNRVIGIIVVAFLLWLIQKTPKRWPYWFAAAMVLLVAFGIFLAPLIFDPLFNKFTPLPATNSLYAPLHILADKAGIPNVEIFVVDKSKQTNELNAYVTGIGSSARIVIWDTLFKKMPPDQIEAVTSHEMGHYVEHHIWIGFALAVIGLFVSFPIIAWLAGWLLARFGGRWGVSSLADPAALPILVLAATFLGYLAGPIENSVSREIEHRADAFGLGLTKNRPAMARAFITLSQEDLDDPNPPAWVKFWLEDHPPLGERIRYALYGQPDQWP